MIASGNIIEDDLIQAIARRLQIGYGSEVTELILDRPNILAQKASRALQQQIAYLGTNDFGEAIFRVGGESEPEASTAPTASDPFGLAGKAGNISAKAPFKAFGTLRRPFA